MKLLDYVWAIYRLTKYHTAYDPNDQMEYESGFNSLFASLYGVEEETISRNLNIIYEKVHNEANAAMDENISIYDHIYLMFSRVRAELEDAINGGNK